MFGPAQPFVFAGIAIDKPEDDQEKEAQHRSHGKGAAPAHDHQCDRDQRHADDLRELRSAIEQRGGEAAFVARKPVPDRL